MANYFGNGSNNSYLGTGSNNVIFGFGGNDNLSRNGGDDFISGGNGNDNLYGWWTLSTIVLPQIHSIIPPSRTEQELVATGCHHFSLGRRPYLFRAPHFPG